MNKQLLLLSASRVGETQYLDHALPLIKEQLQHVKSCIFIPYAGVTLSYNQYTDKVKQALSKLDISIIGIHDYSNPIEAIENAEAVLIGGGNTFRLLERLYHFNLIAPIQHRVNAGMPYIGWSAGSNIAGKTIKTTNDMPIIEPPSFAALSLINCQLNPHYTEYTPPGHNGETREQRLAEFMVLDDQTSIIGIEEGTALKVTGDSMSMVMGDNVVANGYLFKAGKKKVFNCNENLDYLL